MKSFDTMLNLKDDCFCGHYRNLRSKWRPKLKYIGFKCVIAFIIVKSSQIWKRTIYLRSIMDIWGHNETNSFSMCQLSFSIVKSSRMMYSMPGFRILWKMAIFEVNRAIEVKSETSSFSKCQLSFFLWRAIELCIVCRVSDNF